MLMLTFQSKLPSLGLHDALSQSFLRSNVTVPADLKQIACDYSCDGCYEPMFTGRTEFKFAYIVLLKVS